MEKMIYMIGHGKTPLPVFFDTLREHNINVVVDVRSSPFSRHAPQFNRVNFLEECERRNIKYRWQGKRLGGFGEIEHEDFLLAVRDLILDEPICRMVLMCSESDYMKCHRHYKIEPKLLEAGIEVTHLMVVPRLHTSQEKVSVRLMQ